MQGGNMPAGANGAPMAPNAMRPMGGAGPQIPPGMTRGVPAASGGMAGNAAPTTQPVQSAQPTVDPRRLAAVLGSMTPQSR